MNKKGQVILLTFMIGLTFLLLALYLAPALQETIKIARNESSTNTIGLDCGNESISNFDKGACVVSDISLPYFVGFLLFAAGAVTVGRVMFDN